MRFIGHVMPAISKHRTNCKKLNQNKISLFLSFFVVFDRLSVVSVSFCCLIKGISPKICVLCVRVKINKRLFETFCVWILLGMCFSGWWLVFDVVTVN